MAGFGAGFGKAFGSSLESAGKLHQEEQMRAREYERAKADRQAEIADSRAYNDKVRLEGYDREDKKDSEKQSIEDEKDPYRVSLVNGKWMYTARDGSKRELASTDPLVGAKQRYDKEVSQKDTVFGLTVADKKASIRQSEAATANYNSQRKNSEKELNVFTELAPSQRDIVKAIAKFGPYANISDGRGNMIDITPEMVSSARALESSKNPAAAYQAVADLKDILTNTVVGPAPARKEGEPDSRVFKSAPSKAPASQAPFNATPGWSLNNYKK